MKMITALLVATLAISANADKCGNAQGKTGGDCGNAAKSTQILCVPAEKCKLDGGTCKGLVTTDDTACGERAATTEACTPAALCQWIPFVNKKCGAATDMVPTEAHDAETACTDKYAAECKAECFKPQNHACGAPTAPKVAATDKTPTSKCTDIYVTKCDTECFADKGKCGETVPVGKRYISKTDSVTTATTECAAAKCTDAECWEDNPEYKPACGAAPTGQKLKDGKKADTKCAANPCTAGECFVASGNATQPDTDTNATTTRPETPEPAGSTGDSASSKTAPALFALVSLLLSVFM